MDSTPFLCEGCCNTVVDEDQAVAQPIKLAGGEVEFRWWHLEHAPKPLRKWKKINA
jgi:hypothetical protein